MIPDLTSKFTRLEKSRQSVISLMKSKADADLNKNPAEDKWSPLQILYHVIKSEQITIISLRRTLKEHDKKDNTGLREWMSTLLLQLALVSPLKFKAPRSAAEVPAQPDFDEMIKKWDSIRTDFKNVIDTIPAQAITKKLFKHPYSGNMNLIHISDFLISHSEHHFKQIKNSFARLKTINT